MIEFRFYPSSISTSRETIEHFVVQANDYHSSIMIQLDNKTVNAKSILGLLSLGKTPDSALMIIDGEDEVAAFNDLKNFVAQQTEIK